MHPSSPLKPNILLAHAAAGLGLLTVAGGFVLLSLLAEVRELEALLVFVSRVAGTNQALFPATESLATGGATEAAAWLSAGALAMGLVYTASSIALAWIGDRRQAAEHRLKLEQLEAEIQVRRSREVAEDAAPQPSSASHSDRP
jgi:hypothetical protein